MAIYKVRYKSKVHSTDLEWNHNVDEIVGVPDHLRAQALLDYFKERLLADSAPRIIEGIEIIG